VPNGKFDESEIRRIVVVEIQNHLGPMGQKVDKLDRTLRSLYSNGSGGPPGYLETARKEDDERYERLFRSFKELEGNKEVVNTFILLAKDREERQKRYRQMIVKVGWKVCAGVLSAFLILAGWAYREASPVVKILWNDYLKYHPSVSEEIKNISTDSTLVVSSFQKSPEDAGGQWPH
jgi:hypothetical protein